MMKNVNEKNVIVVNSGDCSKYLSWIPMINGINNPKTLGIVNSKMRMVNFKTRGMINAVINNFERRGEVKLARDVRLSNITSFVNIMNFSNIFYWDFFNICHRNFCDSKNPTKINFGVVL